MKKIGLFVAPALVMAAAAPQRPAVTVEREIIAVFVSSATINIPAGMPATILQMKKDLFIQAAAAGRQLRTRGVSLEVTVQDGVRDLASVGHFDEVSVGGNWTNSAVVRYLGSQLSAGANPNAVIPQVILIEREIRSTDTTLEVGPERELVRFRGAGEIGDWVKRGTPLPALVR